MSDLERWRQLFREEAQRCVQELREVMEHGRGVMSTWHHSRCVMILCKVCNCNIFQDPSKSCPIFGVEDIDVTYCHIMLHHLDG